MAGLTASAKWYVFAVKADDVRRARYWRWLSRLRRAEISARREAVERLPTTAFEIPTTAGYERYDEDLVDGVADVIREVRHIRSTVLRAGQGHDKPYLIDHSLEDLDATSPFLTFALADQIVAPVARYLGMVPILTRVTVLASPFIASSSFAGSQLFHCDWEDVRQVKVFVHCTDVHDENGPLTALTAEASRRVKAATGYRYGGPAFRLPDAEVVPKVGRDEVTSFVGPAGAVTFIDTSSCLHLGSRVQPGAAERLVVQFQYLTPSAFDLQFSRRRSSSPFAGVIGDFTPVQRLVLGATR